MERHTLLFTVILLAGCLGGSISGQEAVNIAQTTESYQQLGGTIETEIWEINESTMPEDGVNLSRLIDTDETTWVIYGLDVFSGIDLQPGYIVRASGTDAGMYYHIGHDGTLHGSVSRTELRQNITTRLRQEIDSIRQDIEQRQSCAAIDMDITEAGYDSQTSEAYVVAQQTGTATIETLTITFLGNSTSMDVREETEIVPGDVISAVHDTTDAPTTVRLTVPGCPEAAVQHPLR